MTGAVPAAAPAVTGREPSCGAAGRARRGPEHHRPPEPPAGRPGRPSHTIVAGRVHMHGPASRLPLGTWRCPCFCVRGTRQTTVFSGDIVAASEERFDPSLDLPTVLFDFLPSLVWSGQPLGAWGRFARDVCGRAAACSRLIHRGCLRAVCRSTAVHRGEGRVSAHRGARAPQPPRSEPDFHSITRVSRALRCCP